MWKICISPGLCEVMTSASAWSGADSWLLLSCSCSLSTMAMTQFRPLATLAHTLSYRDQRESQSHKEAQSSFSTQVSIWKHQKICLKLGLIDGRLLLSIADVLHRKLRWAAVLEMKTSFWWARSEESDSSWQENPQELETNHAVQLGEQECTKSNLGADGASHLDHIRFLFLIPSTRRTNLRLHFY